MSTKNRAPRRVPKPLKIPTRRATPTGGGPERLKEAIRNARQIVGCLKKGDEDAIAQATLIQGILSGDVIAASIHARQRLQRENFRLRARIGMQKLKTERTKQKFLELEIEQRTRHPYSAAEVMVKVYEIYGLSPERMQRPQLPASTIDAKTT